MIGKSPHPQPFSQPWEGEARSLNGVGGSNMGLTTHTHAMPVASRQSRTGGVPHFKHELAFWQGGIQAVAGVDEVGRGALAGPLAKGRRCGACGGRWRGCAIRSN
jgi:hypothetical protein